MTRSLSSNDFGGAATGAPTQRFARLTGLIYLVAMALIGFTYGYGQFLVAADAPVALIWFGRTLFELSILGAVTGFVCFLLAALAFYRLFRGVSPAAAAMLFIFVAASVPLSLAGVARLGDILSLLDAAGSLTPPLGPDQIRTPVILSLHGYNNLMQMSAVFWGLWLFPLGYLVYRSRVAPRALGAALMVGGVFYLIMAVGPIFDTGFQSTALARVIGFATFIPGMIGELGTAAWLMIFGAREIAGREHA